MRFSYAAAIALSGSGALAMTQGECFIQNSKDLAELSSCAHHGSLNYCFTILPGSDTADIERCYVKAGCSSIEAASEAKFAADRCREWSKSSNELRKRYRGVLEADQNAAKRTVAARKADPAPTPAVLLARSTTLECMVTTSVTTTSCPLSTSNGHLKTLSCITTVVPSSHCADGLLCSMDSQGKNVCMKAKSIDIGGIIIAIVFGVALILGITFITFQSCKEGRQHKRLEAKAEATALARAATKKARAADARAPLMRQQRQQEGGGTDPFHDSHQS